MSDAGSEHNQSRDDEFRRAVKEYVGLFDEIADIRAVINQKNKRKKALTEFIIAYMRDSEKDICNLGASGMLAMKKQKTTVSLKKEYVQQMLAQILQDEQKAEESTKFIFENREKKETFKLQRLNPV
jgi:cob(I)alamin adenosyltransferase